MSELTYDPEFPYVTRSTFTGYMSARFNKREAAEGWIGMDDSLEIVDTTPKPKIPEDARFLHWLKGGGNYVAVWENFNPTKPWELEGTYYTEEGLLEEIGDAEVTVLVRKEDA